MSISSLILAGTWVFEGNYLAKWERIKSLSYSQAEQMIDALLAELG